MFTQTILLFSALRYVPSFQSLAQVLAKIFKSQICCQTIKYMKVFKLNQKCFFPEMVSSIPVRGVPSFQSLAQILTRTFKSQISSQTITYMYKFKSYRKVSFDKYFNLPIQGVYRVSSLQHRYMMKKRRRRSWTCEQQKFYLISTSSQTNISKLLDKNRLTPSHKETSPPFPASI